MSIQKNSVWLCTDEGMEEVGLKATVVEVFEDAQFNGDGEIEILHSNGTILVMKVRRFCTRYEPYQND
ncbi:hypothetical protein ABD91_20660 [Lysinibacillus sphaericus]|uniref:hypothetical protein n=1 Tax=Lysinibacillus sphaericus TaxID=1421 RepID=UPI0018CD2D5C|nr:hypothetical protein [Lysinibacillus sphaericus]MBG9693155.1 hypothetical protein [Lysinibacillus sphaericus]